MESLSRVYDLKLFAHQLTNFLLCSWNAIMSSLLIVLIRHCSNYRNLGYRFQPGVSGKYWKRKSYLTWMTQEEHARNWKNRSVIAKQDVIQLQYKNPCSQRDKYWSPQEHGRFCATVSSICMLWQHLYISHPAISLTSFRRKTYSQGIVALRQHTC